MKFARYLQDTQTPEWKKAYIDYRGLKVQLGIIRAQVPQQGDLSGATDVDHTRRSAPINAEKSDGPQGWNALDAGNSSSITTGGCLNRASSTSAHIPSLLVSGAGLATHDTTDSCNHGLASPIRRRTSNQERLSLSVTLTTLPPRVTGTISTAPSQQTPLPPRTPRSPPVFPFFRDSTGTPTPQPLHTILGNLPAIHARFFDMLDAELEKVEVFYAEREKEMNERAKRIREQLNELGIHRQMIYQTSTQPKNHDWTKKAHISVSSVFSSWFSHSNAKPEESEHTGGGGILASESGRNGHRGVVDTSSLGTHTTDHTPGSDEHSKPCIKNGRAKSEDERDPDNSSKNNAASSPISPDDCAGSPPKRVGSLMRPFGGTRHPLDPHGYRHAKRRLRKAVVEHYRGLEVLNNYRILNLIGFRKALKKYEKITKNTVLDAYMNEKVEPSAFASGAMVSTMIKEMEDLFAMRFERGDRKKALDRLRVGPLLKTHHLSTFRSGIWLGLALPALAAGITLSFQAHTRASLPAWNILLFIYSILVLPVLLALLIGVNIAVWARERINYVFIFELSPRSRLDHHEYFELPSFLFCTLAYAFWFSFSQIGPPLLWPLIWLALALIIMLSPIRNFMWGPARWWTIKNIAKLGASGVFKVEFTDFWLGDQLCSLVYSLSGMYFVGCFYARFLSRFPLLNIPAAETFESSLYTSIPDNVTTSPPRLFGAETAFQSLVSSPYGARVEEAWETCGTAPNWGWYCLLAVLPFLVRFVQSLRRYRDSNLPTHLINAGKYGMGMIYNFFYYYWRHQEMPYVGASYVLWCFSAVLYTTYACAWDFLMDWSLCKPHARYPLLRTELVYKSRIPSYYFALVSNLCIRFMWLTYIPVNGPNMVVRAFIVAAFEMLRRVQWNFYRLENEHLGNIDQYRVTREVPLPYNFDTHSNDNEDEEDHEEEVPASSPSWLARQTVRLRRNGGHG